MTKEAAITSFFESFGIPAYEESVVPSDATYPRLTYSVSIGDAFQETMLTCTLWWYSTQWVSINAKAEEIRRRLGEGGTLVHYDNGAIWLKRGQPFAQNLTQDNDMVRAKLINIIAEFLES